MQQQPTCTNVRIRSTRDAHKIFFAVQHRVLPMVTRRLDADERLALRSGCVYTWEERGPHTEITGLGIERFTEGRRWSPSRVRDEFLFYYEKYTPPQDANQSSPADKQPPRDWDPLVKQTYSVWVDTEKGRRKWHLTAYFTQATVDQLGTIDDLPAVASVVVPEGTFQSTRISKARKGEEARLRAGEASKPASAYTVTRTYAPFPSQYPSFPGTPFEPSSLHSTHQGYPTPSPPSSHYRSTGQAPQYSIPPPPPPGSLYELPPLRSPSIVDHKDRRMSQPNIEHPFPSAADRRMSLDCQTMNRAMIPLKSLSNAKGDGGPSHLTPLRYDMHNVDSGPSVSGHIPIDSGHAPSPAALDFSPMYTIRPLHYDSVSPIPHQERLPPKPGKLPMHPSQEHDEHNTRPTHLVSTHPYTFPHAHTYPDPHARSRENSSTPHFEAISLPAPTQLFPAESSLQLYEVTSPGVGVRVVIDGGSREVAALGVPAGVGPHRGVDLAPLHSLQRSHPYRRDPVDDRALRMLGPRPS